MTDEELLEQMSQGSSAALETLFYRYHVQLHAYIYRLVGSKTVAEDLTQECFIRIMEAVKAKQLPTSFRPWAYKIAGNLCKDLWRKASYKREIPNEMHLDHALAVETVSSIFEKQLDRELIIQALHQLDEDKRNIIILRFYQELKLGDIAEILDIPLSTVKTRLYQSFKNLTTIINELEGTKHAQAAK